MRHAPSKLSSGWVRAHGLYIHPWALCVLRAERPARSVIALWLLQACRAICARGTFPLALWDLRERRAQARRVIATVASVTEQQPWCPGFGPGASTIESPSDGGGKAGWPCRIKTPIQSCPASTSNEAVTLESTPPDMAMTMRDMKSVWQRVRNSSSNSSECTERI